MTTCDRVQRHLNFWQLRRRTDHVKSLKLHGVQPATQWHGRGGREDAGGGRGRPTHRAATLPRQRPHMPSKPLSGTGGRGHRPAQVGLHGPDGRAGTHACICSDGICIRIVCAFRPAQRRVYAGPLRVNISKQPLWHIIIT